MEKLCYVVNHPVSDFIASIDHAVQHMKRPNKSLEIYIGLTPDQGPPPCERGLAPELGEPKTSREGGQVACN